MRGSKISKLYVMVHSQKNLSSDGLPFEKRDVGPVIEPPQSEFNGGKKGEGQERCQSPKDEPLGRCQGLSVIGPTLHHVGWFRKPLRQSSPRIIYRGLCLG